MAPSRGLVWGSNHVSGRRCSVCVSKMSKPSHTTQAVASPRRLIARTRYARRLPSTIVGAAQSPMAVGSHPAGNRSPHPLPPIVQLAAKRPMLMTRSGGPSRWRQSLPRGHDSSTMCAMCLRTDAVLRTAATHSSCTGMLTHVTEMIHYVLHRDRQAQRKHVSARPRQCRPTGNRGITIASCFRSRTVTPRSCLLPLQLDRSFAGLEP